MATVVVIAITVMARAGGSEVIDVDNDVSVKCFD